jgi:hypothetical protein
MVTVHGVGFQQAPDGPTPGYADQLHEHLRDSLPEGTLGEDPQRPGGGPVYVQSSWPPGSLATEAGLARLGAWDRERAWHVTSAPPLAGPGADVAHVALVYSHLEETGGDPGALASLGVESTQMIGHYASVWGLVRIAVADVHALLAHPSLGAEPVTSSLRVRTDLSPQRHHVLPGVLHRKAPAASQPASPPAGSGLFGTLHQLEDDVAAYVSRNELRERVRSFVREALMRAILRDDVSQVVINTHSNGTVIGYDVLSQLPETPCTKVGALVTAGSPLRKYTDLMSWGTDAGSMWWLRERPWENFWDRADPVADPLAPPPGWRRGQPIPDPASGLFRVHDPDTGEIQQLQIHDVPVDNVARSGGGGLRAHNYWDNPDFVQALAKLLKKSVDSR